MDHATFSTLLCKWRERNQYSQRDAAEVLKAMLEITQVKRKKHQS